MKLSLTSCHRNMSKALCSCLEQVWGMNVHIKLSSEGMVGIVEGWDQQDGKHSQTPK